MVFHHSKNIKFTMEEEENGNIPFLDVLVSRKEDGTLGHKVFRKKTHRESYLHVDSHHHPSQKIGVLNTLAIRASRISDDEHLNEENNHLANIFKNIGYNSKDIKRVLERTKNRPTITPQEQATTRTKITTPKNLTKDPTYLT